MLIAPEIRRTSDFLGLPENNAVGAAGQQFRTEREQELENAVQTSVFWSATVLIRRAELGLIELANLKSNWDTYGAPSPNHAAVGNAIRILSLMSPFDLAAAHIVPSAEGGVGFCFSSQGRYADIEAFNDGHILGVRYAGMEAPVLIQTDGTDDSIKAALEEVRNHIRA